MATDYRAKRLVVEIDDELFSALRATADERSSNVRKVTVADVVRELLANHIMGDARIPSAKR